MFLVLKWGREMAKWQPINHSSFQQSKHGIFLRLSTQDTHTDEKRWHQNFTAPAPEEITWTSSDYMSEASFRPPYVPQVHSDWSSKAVICGHSEACCLRVATVTSQKWWQWGGRFWAIITHKHVWYLSSPLTKHIWEVLSDHKFSTVGVPVVMATLRNTAGHYIFIL